MEYNGSKDFLRCERRGEIYAECSADYSLPDYNGDVRRILFTNAKAHPSGSFENGDSVDFSGIVAYDIVYADSENKINSVSFSSDYDFTARCNADGFVSAHADISVADFSLRLLGPRKISARATVVADVTLVNEETVAPTGDIFCAESSAEVDTDTLQVYYSKRADEIEREYAEELCRLDGAVLAEVNVVYTDAECIFDSATSDGQGINLKGALRICALLQTDDGAMRLEEKTVRVDEQIPYDGELSGLKILPIVSVGSVRHNVNADENGCSVVVNVILRLCAECVGNKTLEIVTDAYSRDADVENTYGEFRFSELSFVATERDDIAGSIERGELEIDGLREVVVLRAEPVIDDCRFADGGVSITGAVNFYGVALGCDPNDVTSYYPFKKSVNFVKNVNINCQNSEKSASKIKAKCYDLSAVVDENQVTLSAKADFEICVMRDGTADILSSSEVVEGSEQSDSGTKIIVYYPERGERLFDIAKRFHTTVEKISADNQTAVRAISDGDFATPARLLIY